MIRLRAFAAAALAAAAIGCSGPAPVIREGTTGIELRLLPAGEFFMGTPANEGGRESQEILHPVHLSNPFYLGVTEVTQDQWRTVMGSNPSHFSACGPDCPVEGVSFHEVEEFLSKLNVIAGDGYRLPTEAEWEYACRADGGAPFGHRATLGSTDANIDGRFPYGAPVSSESPGTMPVGQFPANPWGLHDMSGNVWEWTSDLHCPYTERGVSDPVGGCESAHRVIRGGSWKFDGNSARCGLRYTHRPQDRGFSLGFRVARTVS